MHAPTPQDAQRLFLDLAHDARRSAILSQLRQAMNAEQIANFERATAKLHFDREHYENLIAIRSAIEALDIPAPPRRDLAAVYQILAEAEAQVHESSTDTVHFHEVGAASGIRNAAEIALAFFILEPVKVLATPVQVGCGQVKGAHGIMDIPTPATRAILARGIPIAPERLDGELCTPTSAALICQFVDQFVEMSVLI